MSKSQETFSRQILAFGEEGQHRLAQAKVGIVGLGGIGSLLAQMLAYLGVREFVLVDDDIVEESNLNRLIGASSDDVKNKTSKIEVAQRVIRSINSKAAVKNIFHNLRSEEALDCLCATPKILFGCLDNDSARLLLTELAAAYDKALVDCGTEIINTKGFQEFGGRVIVARPGDFCLLCAGQIDLEIARQELESDQEKRYKQNIGYGIGPRIPNPSVISLNSVIAGLAVTEFLMLVTGLRPPHRKITYKGMRGAFKESLDEKRDDCWVCNFLAGKGQKADIKRYLRRGLPLDLP